MSSSVAESKFYHLSLQCFLEHVKHSTYVWLNAWLSKKCVGISNKTMIFQIDPEKSWDTFKKNPGTIESTGLQRSFKSKWSTDEGFLASSHGKCRVMPRTLARLPLLQWFSIKGSVQGHQICSWCLHVENIQGRFMECGQEDVEPVLWKYNGNFPWESSCIVKHPFLRCRDVPVTEAFLPWTTVHG